MDSVQLSIKKRLMAPGADTYDDCIKGEEKKQVALCYSDTVAFLS